MRKIGERKNPVEGEGRAMSQRIDCSGICQRKDRMVITKVRADVVG